MTWSTTPLVSILWALLAAVPMMMEGRERIYAYAGVVTVGSIATFAIVEFNRRRLWVKPARRLADQIGLFEIQPTYLVTYERPVGLVELSKAVTSLSMSYQRLVSQSPTKTPFFQNLGDSHGSGLKVPMTSTGLYDYPSDVLLRASDSHTSGEYVTTDMVNRLEPGLWRWLESSPAEQDFLGWSLRTLREKSFLEIVHPDDLQRFRSELENVLARGESHGFVLRIRTRHGRSKAIEMNMATRHGPDNSVSHVRCHVTDVTAKVRAEKELRLRTRELTQVNEQLRIINRELEELKERYRDLYQNAPAMYFSINDAGVIIDCNDTLLATLGYRREAIVGEHYRNLVPEKHWARSDSRFAQFGKTGSIEVDTEWKKANGDVIDVWVTASADLSSDGRFLQSRNVAQDVTARHRLEAELKQKNQGLALANVELSRRNKEMDEFTYVVSHDLQEPLRTLIAFSDFLLRDYGDRLDDEGKEFVLYLVNASRRMRSLIQDLLKLSRVGKVTSEFKEVNLGELIATVRSDLTELVRSKGAEIHLDGTPPLIWGDASRIGQLVANLMANGLKYNDKAIPRIVIGFPTESSVDAAFATLSISDNGIGIERQFHDKVFQLFRRLHTQEEYEGTGAGLAICNKIVQAHGGRIWLESEPEVGSTFFVTLPRMPANRSLANSSTAHS